MMGDFNKPNEYLTYDDILIKPQLSDINSRSQVKLESKLTKNITLKIPIISANMDTITEDKMAIALAKLGGLGIIHRYCSIDEQVNMVKNVKRYTNYIIYNPYTINENDNINNLAYSSYLVVNNENKLVGIISTRDLLYNKFIIKSTIVKDFMNKNLIVINKDELLNGEKYIIDILVKNKIEKLPIVNSDNSIYGLITLKDILYRTENKHIALLDNEHQLIVGAAVGVKGDYLERTIALVNAGCDIICIDVAHGHHTLCGNAVKEIKKLFPDVPIIAGNVCTREGVKYLYECGTDVVKVGIGGGSICITRIQTGCGMPQFTSVLECANEAKKLGITIIADGGHSGKSGNIFKALCAGASCSMLGGMLSGTDETPGDVIVKNNKKMKLIRGMAGRLSNLNKVNRTGEDIEITSFVPEGVEGYVPYKGNVKDIIHQICGGIRSGMSYIGCKTIEELHNKDIEFLRITQAGSNESGAHHINEI